jgi:AcrR family transcriptional regulator
MRRKGSRVGRPKIRLVSRRATLEAGLRIVDSDGLHALTIRRLAAELNINGASLYHHFANKEEILAGVASLALEDVRTPRAATEDWQEWLLRNFHTYRQVLLAHPALVPVLVRRHPMRIGLREFNSTASLLAVQGVPAEFVMPLVESLEAIALGSVLLGSAVENDPQAEEWRDEYPHLYFLASQVSLGREETFDIVCRGVIDSFARLAVTWEQVTA